MKILFIFTGGTIGSTLQKDNVIATDAKKSYKIIEAYGNKYGIDFDYDVCEPYTELSENNTGEHIRMLSACVEGKLDCGYDGIVITHGTDTLQYSAAAMGYLLGASSVPVCLVSANRPIEHERSNALENLHGAISLIKDGSSRGAFVIYRNDNSKVVRVHRATRLIGSKSFSDDVSSIFGCIYGHFDSDYKFVKNENYLESKDEVCPLPVNNISDFSEGVAVLFPYTGMIYPEIGKKTKFILLNTYHSGTINTKSESAKEFFLKAKEMGITVYAVGIPEGPEYQSSKSFEELGIIPLKNISPVAAYVKLWLLSKNEGDVTDIMKSSLSGDTAPAK
ncbi:MAG: asparaginase [Clostridia bacterium]|nr:asparaginase [Clostridia bacterium]